MRRAVQLEEKPTPLEKNQIQRGGRSVEKMLEIRDVKKNFGGIKALDGCSMMFERGQITGLIGPNGAGKTTLFNTITGFYQADSGSIRYMDNELIGLHPHQIFAQKIVRTFQVPREMKSMTVLENLMLVPENQLGEKLFNTWFRTALVDKEEDEIREKALEVLEFVNLIHLKDEFASNLSGGQKKLLELARVMMAEPETILLDEPGAGVNPTLMKKILGMIRELNTTGKTFIVIEHDMDMIMDLCNPIIVMNRGQTLTQGEPEEIRNDDRVLEAYLGE